MDRTEQGLERNSGRPIYKCGMSSFIYALVTAYWWQTAKVGGGIILANRYHGIGSWANPSQDSPANSGILHWHSAAALG